VARWERRWCAIGCARRACLDAASAQRARACAACARAQERRGDRRSNGAKLMRAAECALAAHLTIDATSRGGKLAPHVKSGTQTPSTREPRPGLGSIAGNHPAGGIELFSKVLWFLARRRSHSSVRCLVRIFEAENINTIKGVWPPPALDPA